MPEDTQHNPEPFTPQAWIRRADSDLTLARLAAEAEDVLWDSVGKGEVEEKIIQAEMILKWGKSVIS